MVSEKEIKYLKQIKQLEEENRVLKHRILSKMLSDNTEITRLNLKIVELEKSGEYWKDKVYLFRAKEKLNILSRSNFYIFLIEKTRCFICTLFLYCTNCII